MIELILVTYILIFSLIFIIHDIKSGDVYNYVILRIPILYLLKKSSYLRKLFILPNYIIDNYPNKINDLEYLKLLLIDHPEQYVYSVSDELKKEKSLIKLVYGRFNVNNFPFDAFQNKDDEFILELLQLPLNCSEYDKYIEIAKFKLGLCASEEQVKMSITDIDMTYDNVMILIKVNTYVYNILNDDMKNNLDIIKETLSTNPSRFVNIPEQYLDIPEIIKLASNASYFYCQQYGDPHILYSHDALARKLSKRNMMFFEFCSENVKNDPLFVLKLIENIDTIEYTHKYHYIAIYASERINSLISGNTKEDDIKQLKKYISHSMSRIKRVN